VGDWIYLFRNRLQWGAVVLCKLYGPNLILFVANLGKYVCLIVATCIFVESLQFISQLMHIISHKTLLKHFKTLRHVSILSDHHQGALFLAKVIFRYSHSILICKRGVVAAYHVVWECVVEQWLGVRRTTHT